MQHKDRSVGSGLVDFFQSWHAPLGELELRPAADHAHPLGRRRALCLLLQHTQGVGKRRHAIPTQFHIVVEATADRMHVRIVETRDHRSAAEIDCFRVGSSQTHNFFVGANADKAPILNGNGFSKRS